MVNEINTTEKFIIREVANFKLFFGKYKGQLLSATPKTYQAWLIQSDFYKNLNIKFPVKVKKRNFDDVWWDVEMVKVQIPNPNYVGKSEYVPSREDDAEARYWRNMATCSERFSY